MQRKIIYFINPISGTKDKASALKIIAEKTQRQNIPFQILNTNAQGNYFFLKEKIEKEGITDIVICGGDGTVSQIASSLIDEDINIGIIPMGSGNGLALAAKIPKEIHKALEVIFTGKGRYIDSFFINDVFSCMLCGLGFDAQVAHDFAKQPSRGLSTYIKQTIKNFITASPYPFEIVNKGKSFAIEAFFISIANSNQFGNQFTIAPQASLNDGLLDIVVVKKMSKLRMLLAVFKQIMAGKINEHDEKTFHKKDILYFQTEQLIIYNLVQAPLHIDGDPAHTAKKLVIKIIPDAFKLIQPAIKKNQVK
ncbi:diacylglycerol kinase family protein [Ferruginibacter sp.]|uniref:diacylglycerol/lipid kinase family protein n=1 Tax=Ferruginibacter sp. TaxID=1940288 RepID=UPI0019BB4DA1|nr:YegS/Rv2252/BmrU family lipid kinase [Ferruginibacter sp.]MBC7625915.1 YegS/Rv2252/BmrU family lipid kinase [Ferruginibacter sp.]